MTRHIEYPDIPFHELLRRAAERRPDAPAILFRDRTITYGDWDRHADRVANGLAALGLQKGDRVALYLSNCPEYEVAFFGCARMGAVPTPLNPSYKEREVRHQVADSGARAAIVHQALYPVLEAACGDLPELQHVIVVGDTPSQGIHLFADLVAGGQESVRDLSWSGDDLAALPYSSGTTGVSKGVMLTQSNLVCNALQFVEATGSTESDTLLIFLPLYHIYGVALMATAVASGARQVLMERFDLAEVVRLVQAEGVTELYVVPPVMLALANAPDLRPEQFEGVRFIMSAAAPLSPDIARRVAQRLKVRVIQAYGMTETSPLTHMVPLDQPGDTMESVGVPAADTECRIVDIETGERELPAGEVGEVTVAGPQVMAGYWNAPEETHRTIRTGWIHTGDVGREDEEGNLFIVDRMKEMIKYKAFSIAPAELEGVLLEHPAVVDCAVIGQPDEEAGEVPRAFVVLRPSSDTTDEELRAFVQERVAGYKQIRRIDLLEAIPRTPSGKILRRVLKERARAESTVTRR